MIERNKAKMPLMFNQRLCYNSADYEPRHKSYTNN